MKTMKHQLLVCCCLVLVALTWAEENVEALNDVTDIDDVIKPDVDDLDLDVDNDATSRLKRQTASYAAAGGGIGGPSMGPPMGGSMGGPWGGGSGGGGPIGGPFGGGGMMGGMGGMWYGGWDPCLTPMQCPRCRDINMSHSKWCRDICLDWLPKWCFCWL